MTYPFSIRRAQPADREAVSALCLAADPHDWVPDSYDEIMQESEPGGLYLAETAERLVGCFRLSLIAPGEAFFSAMRIHPEVQGRGFGTLFAQAQVEKAHAEGVEHIYLHSQVENVRAHRAVAKAGFLNLGEWAIYWGMTRVALAGRPERARWAQEFDRPLIDQYRQSRVGAPIDRVISLPNDPWVMRTECDEDWDLARQVVVAGDEGLEGIMTVYSDTDGLYIRRLEGSAPAAADLLEFAVVAWRQWGVGDLHLSLPLQSDRLVRPLGLEGDVTFRTYVFKHTQGRSE